MDSTGRLGNVEIENRVLPVGSWGDTFGELVSKQNVNLVLI
jgi:hypothetical protein